MERIAQHKVLVAGDSYDHCCEQVRKFFRLTSLVMYDSIEVIRDKCVGGSEERFFDELAAAEAHNRQTVDSLVEELQQTGTNTVDDLRALKHGYPSKVLHVLSHMLDGFIGIDSYFYNLPADSHWLNQGDKQKVEQNRDEYWLIHIDCFSTSPGEATILRM